MMNTFYCLNQYLYNHFESSVLIVTNCSDYLHIELLLSYCVRVTVHYCVHAVSVISFLCVRAFIYHCVHIFTVLPCHLHCVRDIAIFVCLKHLNAYTNFCINVNSDRFSESAFEFVWHLFWVYIFTSLYILLIL